jgi:hypothetical protein
VNNFAIRDWNTKRYVTYYVIEKQPTQRCCRSGKVPVINLFISLVTCFLSVSSKFDVTGSIIMMLTCMAAVLSLSITLGVEGFTSLPKPFADGYDVTCVLQQQRHHSFRLGESKTSTIQAGIFDNSASDGSILPSRRGYMMTIAIGALAITTQTYIGYANAAESSTLDTILLQIQKARQQMNAVPDLIKNEQWDNIRAILITPPLSDLWTKSARKSPLLQDYANFVGDIPSGDELAVLEAKEDVEGHLRFLDMAVYNNVFNPIKSVGESGVTKELVRSYYDDPINEYKASVAALDNLIQLGSIK